jgi:hypothetical protein
MSARAESARGDQAIDIPTATRDSCEQSPPPNPPVALANARASHTNKINHLRL